MSNGHSKTIPGQSARLLQQLTEQDVQYMWPTKEDLYRLHNPQPFVRVR